MGVSIKGVPDFSEIEKDGEETAGQAVDADPSELPTQPKNPLPEDTVVDNPVIAPEDEGPTEPQNTRPAVEELSPDTVVLVDAPGILEEDEEKSGINERPNFRLLKEAQYIHELFEQKFAILKPKQLAEATGKKYYELGPNLLQAAGQHTAVYWDEFFKEADKVLSDAPEVTRAIIVKHSNPLEHLQKVKTNYQPGGHMELPRKNTPEQDFGSTTTE